MGGMKETRMKSELFTSRLGEKIVFGDGNTPSCAWTQFAYQAQLFLFPSGTRIYLVRVSRQRNSAEQVERK